VSANGLSIGEAYRGRSVLLTGGTGFLGTAIIWKVLKDLPEIGRLYLLVRPSRDKGAEERFRELVGSAAFRQLREELGEEGFERRVAEKVRVLEGDVHASDLGLQAEDLAELSREVDAVVHSAASVVFDAPLDAAVGSNVRGTLGLLGLARSWEKGPVFVHISTSYVAGTREGRIPEEPPGGETPTGAALDPEAEVLRLDAIMQRVDGESRERGLTKRFETEARRELGMVGEEAEVAERAETLRRAWMRERLVEEGNARARELGWQDVYTFTKSLAERLVLRERGHLPLVILRPAIIESALREPCPGWIQGSRMADPIIMAFAKGILREFPGDPNSIVDIVPVDHVVNATVAAVGKAMAERPDEPQVYQVASGARNPLRYRDLYDIVRGYFLEHPLRDSGGRPVPVPEWSFPGRRRVEGLLRAEMLGLKAANALTARMPEGHLKTDLRGRVARAEKRSRMSLYYSRIYGPYANMMSTFSADRTHALYASLSPEDRRTFPFDVSAFGWREYLVGAHLPALTQKPGSKKRRARKEEKAGQVAAIFDVDGTLVASNVVAYYAWLKLHDLPPAQRPLFVLKMLLYAPLYWGLDKLSRTQFNRVFYRNYRGWKPARASELGRRSFAGYTVGRLFPEAVETLREHKKAGHRVVILSGALDFLLEPFRELADDILSASLEEEGGVYTGELTGAPVAGEARARMLASYARKRGVDLSRSYAYADAISDLPMLEAVGNPVAVNPDRRLRAAAEEKGWEIRDWRRNGAPPRGKSG